MFPREIWFNPLWCLYDATDRRVLLKRPFRTGIMVPCPHCGNPLRFDNYKAACCERHFSTGFGEVRQLEAAGSHNRMSGRGWDSLRVYKPERASE
ncbi:MAG: hypothetical protein ACREQX_04585 [Candidatus Binataceae bacterium]